MEKVSKRSPAWVLTGLLEERITIMEKRYSSVKTLSKTTFLALLFSIAFSLTTQAATLSPKLSGTLSGLANGANVGVVIVTFQTTSGLNESHLNLLRSLGVTRGRAFEHLGMVAFPATAGQVRALATNSSVRSIWSNDRLSYYDNQTRTLTGVEKMRAERQFINNNGGLPVSGRGNFSVVINDSGIDATHDDLKFGDRVIQNVQLLTDSETVSGFTSLQVAENIPDTDLNIGHGTHCAGIIGGTGQTSGGLYAGVAPGAKLIGTGSGAVLFVLNALGGFEYSLANQYRYSIRVISNSYGSNGAFNPDDPLNVATKNAYDRNIIVVFAAGNSGPGRETHNRYAKAPWVISVAAGTKEGGLASFSSRGTPKEERLSDDDPFNDFDAPTLTAPGTGREFDSDAGKFTAAIISARSKANLFANGLTDDAEIPTQYLPFYTQISGTSMACPFIAGTVALMLEVNPSLTPDEVKQILTETATRMPGYEEFQVGAGYVNVYAVVDKVFHRAKAYGALNHPTFNEQITTSGPAAERLHIDYLPAPSPVSSNSRPFNVVSGMDVLDVFATFDNVAESGDGNILSMQLTAPNGATYASPVALPVLDAGNRQVVVKNPLPGQWTVAIRGYNGVASPTPVEVTVRQKHFNLAPITDILGHPSRATIESVLINRMMDTFDDGRFRPNALVTREDLARTLALNVPLRQALADTPKFTDVSADFTAIAEAISAQGATLRDYNFTPQGLLGASGATFNPSALVNRLDVAVAFVRALGRDSEARAKANTVVMSGGQPLSDNAEIPASLRGYVQLALDKGLFEAFPAEIRQIAPGQVIVIPGPRFEPNTNITRAVLATKLGLFAQAFATGQ
jgi:serine protease AprX